MRVEFREVLTDDGLVLHGAAFLPPSDPLGAVVLVHGMGGSKLEHPYQWWLGEALADAGWLCVVGDNRGAATLKEFADRRGRSRMHGCAREVLADAPLDVAAWCGAVPAAVDRIVLAGHSLGAAKVVLGHRADPRVRGLALLAPADLVALVGQSRGLAEALAVAEPAIGTEEETRLLDDLVFAGWPEAQVSARTLWQWRERGAPGDVIDASRPDVVTPLAEVDVPIVTIIGGADTCMGVDPALGVANLAAQAKSAPSFDAHVLPGVDHHYTGARRGLVDPFLAFVESRPDR